MSAQESLHSARPQRLDHDYRGPVRSEVVDVRLNSEVSGWVGEWMRVSSRRANKHINSYRVLHTALGA